jgi:hypothetical protein
LSDFSNTKFEAGSSQTLPSKERSWVEEGAIAVELVRPKVLKQEKQY